MEPSSNKNKTSWKVWLDRAALTGLIASFSLYIQPVWAGGLRVGFYATMVFTIFHIVTSHMTMPEES